ncbi:MAG: preprotein translocase subunit SecG [Clostridia bacterium]|nr:preprotein translocase subunit SecG [Clostridia bacterium]MDD4572459.1 preprotein translocase subunit SecG [Clostridia bacterium]
MEIFLLIIQLISALGLIATILLQSSKSAGMSGAIAGGAETLFGKKKGRDEILSKITIVLTVVFLLLTLIIVII